jgi:hypothetical protein
MAFLSEETEKSYKWVLSQFQVMMYQHQIQQPLAIVTDRELALMKAIDALFPNTQHFLCRWHVNMNILAKTKKYFPGPIKGKDGTWRRHPKFKEFLQACVDLFNSESEAIYAENLEKLQRFNQGAVNYVVNTWLLWKEKLVRCWVDQHLHFGVLVTSPIEGCHSILKQYLQRSNRDLAGVFSRLELFWASQQRGILQAVAQDQVRPKHNINIHIFAELIGHIHGYALRKLLQEVSKLPRVGTPNPECKCTIQGTMGLPCFHTIWERTKDGGVIRVQDLHPHWLYDRSVELNQGPPLLQVLNPVVTRRKGRPKGAMGRGKQPESSTKRLASAFELPSSTAPPAVDLSPIPKEQLYIIKPSTTRMGIARCEQGHIDSYEPGTARERGYMKAISSLYKDDHMELPASLADKAMLQETQDCIEVEVPDALV